VKHSPAKNQEVGPPWWTKCHRGSTQYRHRDCPGDCPDSGASCSVVDGRPGSLSGPSRARVSAGTRHVHYSGSGLISLARSRLPSTYLTCRAGQSSSVSCHIIALMRHVRFSIPWQGNAVVRSTI